MKKITGLTLLLLSMKSYAGTGLGDANDETSFYLWKGGSISANFKDKSAKVSYLKSISDKSISYGITLKGKATDNSSVIFDGDSVTPETTISIPVIYHWIFSDKAGKNAPDYIVDDWLVLELKYLKGEYQMFDSTNVFDEQLFKEEQGAGALAVSYNAIFSGKMLFGTSIEYGKTNNYASLDSITVNTITSTGASGSSSRTSNLSTAAREGDYKEFNQVKSNIDIMYYTGRIGVNLFARYKNSSEQSSNTNMGIGVFLLKEGSPTRIVGGITFLKDNEKNENILGVVIGYNF